jgi:peptidoglycan hydrolase-like protein with peptidoglycan-binding domain
VPEGNALKEETMKTTIRFSTAKVATTLIAAAVLLFALPAAAQAADWKVASLATAPIAKGAGYELPNGSYRVRHLQRQLRRLGHRPGPIDGLFGPLTEGAVRRFQRRAGLRTDGLVGPRTATRLDSSMASIHRRALERRQVSSHSQNHRSLSNDGRAVVNSGRSESGLGTAERSSAGTPPVLTGLLIALSGALALALLSTLAPRHRASATRSREPDVTESPIPAATDPSRERHEPLQNRGETVPATTGAATPEDTHATLPLPERRRPRPGSGAAVIGYVAVGEEERLANGESYAAQAQAIETFCRRYGLRLVRIVRDVDSGGSRSAPAPGLQHACQALARGEARALVVEALGRVTRSPARLALLLRWLADADRALIAIDNELDTSTAAGRKTAEALIEVGDWDRELAQRRTSSAQRRGSGRPAVRDLPELHARIAAMRERGLSLHAIADTLNAEGVPTLRGGSYWRPSSVQAAVGYKRPTSRHGSAGLTLPEPSRATADEEAEL